LIFDDIVRRAMLEIWPLRESSDPDILFSVVSGGPSDDDIGFDRSYRLGSFERSVVVVGPDFETASDRTPQSPLCICVFAKPSIAFTAGKAMRSGYKP
jgi:hypothetical protein